ncbi:hypothetical protein TI05_07805 [Achromatium sp. WMS3]|nr:hypothetical protein TI05_07805 [Achromatium sp. WMS3]
MTNSSQRVGMIKLRTAYLFLVKPQMNKCEKMYYLTAFRFAGDFHGDKNNRKQTDASCTLSGKLSSLQRITKPAAQYVLKFSRKLYTHSQGQNERKNQEI